MYIIFCNVHNEAPILWELSTPITALKTYLIICNDFNFSMLKYTNTRIGCSQIDSDSWSFRHFWWTLNWSIVKSNIRDRSDFFKIVFWTSTKSQCKFWPFLLASSGEFSRIFCRALSIPNIRWMLTNRKVSQSSKNVINLRHFAPK